MDEPANKPLIPFTPVPLRTRRDGWTVEKQIAFIEALAENGIVEEACRRVGMSRTSADKLRARPCGDRFREAWDAALEYALYRLEEDARTRSRHGVVRPIFYKGEQVGEYRHYDERLTMFLLRTRRPERYGRWIDRMEAPVVEQEMERDPAIVLDGALEAIVARAIDIPPDEEDDLDELDRGEEGPEQP